VGVTFPESLLVESNKENKVLTKGSDINGLKKGVGNQWTIQANLASRTDDPLIFSGSGTIKIQRKTNSTNLIGHNARSLLVNS
jgi:hypothetical protein